MSRFASRAWLSTAALGALLVGTSSIASCGTSTTPPQVRSMERPKDVDFICMKQTGAVSWTGVDIALCGVDDTNTPLYQDVNASLVADGGVASTDIYHLHAVVTQEIRGELAVVDLGQQAGDTAAPGLIKENPREPGYGFLPVGGVPTDVVADPKGRAVYVASGVADPATTEAGVGSLGFYRVDIIPGDLVRGPIPAEFLDDGEPVWPHLLFDVASEGTPSKLVIGDVDVAPGTTAKRLYVLLADAVGGPRLAVFDIESDPVTPTRLPDIQLGTGFGTGTAAPLAGPRCATVGLYPPAKGKTNAAGEPWWNQYEDACALPHSSALPLPVVDPTVPPHLSSMVIVGDTMFATDDAAPFVHAFDLTNGSGAEIARINVGAKLTSLAVSPIVPDEVTPGNADVIELCESMDWVGDGQDHVADAVANPYTKAKLAAAPFNGKCNAHRYLYGIEEVAPTAPTGPITPDSGNGSIVVVDVPVLLPLVTDAKGNVELPVRISRNYRPTDYVNRPTGSPAGTEKLDLASLTVAQPFACDAPNFVTTRIPVGSFGLGGGNSVPAKAVTFFRSDPGTLVSTTTSTNELHGVRCRATSVVDYPAAQPLGNVNIDANGNATAINFCDPTANCGGSNDGGGDDQAAINATQTFAATAPTAKPPPGSTVDVNASGGIGPTGFTENDRRAAATLWQTGLGTRRLRGTFAAVALANGAVIIVDVDDFDSLCRGPQTATGAATNNSTAAAAGAFGVEPSINLGPTASNEVLDRPVLRHHPRASILYTADQGATHTPCTLSIPNGATTACGTGVTAATPHFIDLSPILPAIPGSSGSAAAIGATYVAPSSDSPAAVDPETWSSVYEGSLAGLTGLVASLEPVDMSSSAPSATFTITDPNVGYCGHGVEDANVIDPKSKVALGAAKADFIEVTSDVCGGDADPTQSQTPTAFPGRGLRYPCTPNVRAACLLAYGDITNTTVAFPAYTGTGALPGELMRDLTITTATDGSLTLTTPHDPPTPIAVAELSGPGEFVNFATCFPSLVSYSVRARGQWVVTGSSSGYLHDIVIGPTGECTHDAIPQPAVFHGRVAERAAPSASAVDATQETDLCSPTLFVNPSFMWEIEAGSTSSQRDMVLSFTVTRPELYPLSYSAGSLATSVKMVGVLAGDRDLLGWNQIASIDGVDRGLVIVNALDLSSSLAFN